MLVGPIPILRSKSHEVPENVVVAVIEKDFARRSNCLVQVEHDVGALDATSVRKIDGYALPERHEVREMQQRRVLASGGKGSVQSVMHFPKKGCD